MMESNPHDISVDEYVDAFREIESEMTSNQRTILLTHYQTPGFSATARELGRGFHYKSNAPVNRQYGALGKLLCEVLGVDERPYLNVLLWSDLNSRAEHKLTLYKEPAEAIRILGWAGDGEETAEGSSADEEGGSASGAVEFEYSALEGTRIERVSLDRARSDALRQRKIDDAKSKSGGRLCCEVPGCGFDFATVYGKIGNGFIHVHHKKPLATRSAPEVTPLGDLALVCANCHAMIHAGGACRDLEHLIKRAPRQRK
jgi:hypothetical protein